MPFRGAGLVAPASRRQFCAAAGVQKIAGETPALPNPNFDDEARDHRADPSNRPEKPGLRSKFTAQKLSQGLPGAAFAPGLVMVLLARGYVAGRPFGLFPERRHAD